MESNILGNGVYKYEHYFKLAYSPYDLFIGTLTLMLVWYIGKKWWQIKFKNTKFDKLFIYGLAFRLFCVWLNTAIFRFYYQGTDSNMYHSAIIDISHESWSFWWEFITDIWNKAHDYSRYGNINGNAAYYLLSEANAGIVRIGLVVNFLALDSFLATTTWFSFFAFVGLWRLYQVFLYFYPTFYKELGIFILFSPSAVFWSSGILKDPLCIGALGFLMYYTTSIFFWYKKIIPSIILAFISGLTIFILKPYIIIAFAPALMAWLFFQYNHKIENKVLRGITFMLVLVIAGIVGLKVFQNLTENESAKRFGTEALIESIKQQTKNFNITGGGSVFSLGDFDPTPAGLVKKLPAAINATLYRPYLWEVKNPLMLISALESFIILIITLVVLFRFKFNIFKILVFIISQPMLLFSLIFIVIFAGAVGLSTSNFGALVRYKIPCLPFLGLLLSALWYKSKEITKPKMVTT